MPSMAPSWTPKIEWSTGETPKTEDFEEKAFFDFFVSFPYLFPIFLLIFHLQGFHCSWACQEMELLLPQGKF